MKRYCLGFAFTPDKEAVLLIVKERPDWQKGKLNGVGGHIEDNESGIESMVREFEEETGIITTIDDWNEYAIMKREGDFECFVYKAFFGGEINMFQQKTDEFVCLIPVHDIQFHNTISNLNWLIKMALDTDDNFYANIEYNVIF